MANFTPSNLVNAQAIFSQKFLSGEWRLPDVAAFITAATAGVANPALDSIRTREDRTVNAYLPIRQAATNGTARAHNHTGARGDSQAETITWSIFSEPYSISLKQADNNVLAFEQMIAATQRNAILNLVSRIDAAFVAALVADKTQENSGGGNGTFNSTDDVYELPDAYNEYFFQEIQANMAYNDYKGMLTVLTDNLAGITAGKLEAQGGGNSTNLNFQFGNMDIVNSNRTILGTTDYKGSAIAWETGTAAYLPWIPKQNRKPLDPTKAMSYVGDYGSISVPELGVDLAIHSYADRANTSSSNGQTQDVILYQEISIDMGYVSAPLSTFRAANDSVVYGFGQLKT